MSDIADRALAAYKQDQLAEAARLARDALADEPHDAAAKGVLGLVRGRRRDIREAARLLTEAIRDGAREEELPAALAYAFGRLNGPAALATHLAKLLKAHPDNTALRIELAQLYHRQDKPEAELAVCREGIDSGDAAPELTLLYGRALLAAGQAEKAAANLKRYVDAVPGDPNGHYLLGAARRAAGNLEEARNAFLAAMNQEPFYPRAFYSYMRSARMSEDDPVVQRFDQLEALLRTADSETASYYHYGMGKAFEDQGRYEQAWRHYMQGGNCLVRTGRYDRAGTEREFETIRSLFPQSVFEGAGENGDTSGRPIFIVGMPRSGSTLLEQILARHPHVTALGEILDLDRLCRPILERPAAIDLSAVPWRQMSERYLAATRAYAGTGDRRTVDKGLHNFRHLGFIRMMFPNAVILHAMRDPLDTCFSCFSLRFAYGHDWSNRLSDVAHYYRCYKTLMAHWDEVLPGFVTPVRYESLVENFEAEVRRLLEHCGLEWDPACLTFHQSDRSVRTASAAQVRKPLGKGSVGRWKRFEPYLDELKEALEDTP